MKTIKNYIQSFDGDYEKYPIGTSFIAVMLAVVLVGFWLLCGRG